MPDSSIVYFYRFLISVSDTCMIHYNSIYQPYYGCKSPVIRKTRKLFFSIETFFSKEELVGGPVFCYSKLLKKKRSSWKSVTSESTTKKAPHALNWKYANHSNMKIEAKNCFLDPLGRWWDIDLYMLVHFCPSNSWPLIQPGLTNYGAIAE